MSQHKKAYTALVALMWDKEKADLHTPPRPTTLLPAWHLPKHSSNQNSNQQEQGLVRLKAVKGWLTIPTAQGHKLELPSPLKQTRVVGFSSLPLRITLNTKTAAEALFF